MKYYVILTKDGFTVKQALRKWFREERANLMPGATTYRLVFTLMINEGFKSEIIGNEFLLISPESSKNGADQVPVSFAIQLQNIQKQQAELYTAHENLERTGKTLEQYVSNYNKLKSLGLIRNQKDFTGQFGEWIAGVLFEATMATSGNQEDWDLLNITSNEKYQVKSHAKAAATKARWSSIPYGVHAKIDWIIIVVFNEGYYLECIYKVDFQSAVEFRNSNLILNWSSIEHLKMPNLKEELDQKKIGFVFEKI